jgi:Ca-activated chloride channel family protein
MPYAQRDYYQLLGVGRNATPAAIKRAYHAAARKFHPDRNLRPGETEMFLDVQRAYEVLSDPGRRADYDAALPSEETRTDALKWTVQYSRQHLIPLDEPQLIYALLEIEATEAAAALQDPPLNLCLLLDRSTSMQGTKIEMAKAAAIRMVQMLRPRDFFSLIAFGDRAEVLVSTGFGRDPREARSRIQALQASGGTEIFRGLEAGLRELRRGLVPGQGNHLILLTDGHTYGDEAACLQLAAEAAAVNIGISGFGVGGDWNDIFVDELAGKTGGNTTYISRPDDIEHLLIEKFSALSHALLGDIVLKVKPVPGVSQSYAFRIQPEGGPIEVQERLHLGPILSGAPLRVLIELTVEGSAVAADQVAILIGTLEPVTGSEEPTFAPIHVRLQMPVRASDDEQVPPASLMTALSKLSLYRLQERARLESQSGLYEAATRHLRHLAVRLESQGEHRLSQTASREAQHLEQTHALSREGEKNIKYRTRALLLPPPEATS